MTAPFEYRSIVDAAEVKRLGALVTQCFASPSGLEDRYMQRIGTENFRVIYQQATLVGGLATIPMGQWFGGQRVPMTGIAAVGIAPEHRGTGGAIALMRQTVQALHQSGVALSALYPAVQGLYRKAGYEQGGSYCGWKIATDDIHLRTMPLPLQPITPSIEQLSPIYQHHAQLHNGLLDRHPCLWHDILDRDDKHILYAYLIGSSESPEGYIIFDQQSISGTQTLKIRDWAALSPAAAQSLWGFLGSHRSQIELVQWQGAQIDGLTLVLPEQAWKQRFGDRWMLRIIDVVQALEARGYPLPLETELHLTIQDDLIPPNSGAFILSVANGKGTVTPGGTGDLALDIRGLASLYTGLFSPHQLQLAGYLSGRDSAQAIATQLFAGAEPWMPDFF